MRSFGDFLSKAGLDFRDIHLILHTHGHADHFGGDKFFPHAELWMHSADAKALNAKNTDYAASSMLGANDFPSIQNFFQENQPFNLFQFKLKVIFTPGHTAGGVCFLEKENRLLFSGDTLFKGAVGRTDLASGNRLQLQKSIEKLSSLDFNFLFPGHGETLKGNQKPNIEKALSLLK